MLNIIREHHETLIAHPVYDALEDINSLRTFMECHVFAVWDFMSVLKGLQNKVTCTSLPWRPSSYSPDIVQMINEIVLGEESDTDPSGKVCSHFELYIKAMKEIGADTSKIEYFIESINLKNLPKPVKAFVESNLDIAINGRAEEIAASFFYGREKLLPHIFEKITAIIKNSNINCPTLIYYFERHIEVDGDMHGPLAQKCLEEICGDDEAKKLRAQYAGIQALRQRQKLWDNTLSLINQRKPRLYSVH